MPQLAFDFILGADLSSRLIAWYGQGYGGYSHVAPVLADGRYLDARNDVIDGVPPGVHIRDPNAEKWIKKRRVTMSVSQPCYDAWEANLRARIGDQYGRTDILAFITGREDHLDGHWVCSAHALDSVQHVKIIPYPLVTAAHQITPNACLLMFEAVRFVIGSEVHSNPP